MPTLTLDGVGKVQVDDNFLQLSPADQQKTVDEILASIGHGQQAAQPAPDGSLGNAAKQSLLHQLPASLASGLAGLGNTALKDLGYTPENGYAPSKVTGALDAFADRQRALAAANYQRPADVPASIADAVSGSSGVIDAAKRVGQASLYGAAENAGPLGSALATAPLLATPLAPLAAGNDVLQSVDAVRQAKSRAGLDNKALTLPDIAAAGIGSAVNAMPGVGEAAPLLMRPLVGAVNGATRAASGAAVPDIDAMLQGGQFRPGEGVMGNLKQIGSDALDAAGSGAVLGGAGGAANTLGSKLAQVRNDTKVPPTIKAYADATAPWEQAIDTARQQVAKQNPQMPPDQVEAVAMQQAQASGATPPTFDQMTPAAQQGMAELSALQMYRQRLATMTAGMGKDADSVAPTQVFKGIVTDIGDNMKRFANNLSRNDMIDADQKADLLGAVDEAVRHTKSGGEGGAGVGYFDTLRDRVAALPIDPAWKNQALAQLRVADIASQASLIKNARGPLENAVRAGLPVATLASMAVAPMSGIPGAEWIAGLAGHYGKGMAMSGARSLDQLMGTGVPDILRRQSQIEDFAQRKSLKPSADPTALNAINAQLAGLQALPPQGAPSGPSGPAPGPVAPGPAPSPQPAPQPAPAAPAGPTGAMQAVNALLQAQAAQKAAEAQKMAGTIPHSTKGWMLGASQVTGVDPQVIPGMLQQAGKSGTIPQETVDHLLANHVIAPDVLRAATSFIRENAPAQAPAAAPGATAAAPPAPVDPVETAMRLASYQASIQQARDAANAVRTGSPDLAPAVAAIEAQSHVADKGDTLADYLKTIKNPKERARQEALLRPLTMFGSRNPKGPSKSANDN